MPRFNFNYHAEIAIAAAPDGFDPDSLKAIVTADMLVDLDQTQSALHFDNCAFAPGVARIQSMWALIKQGQDVLQNFGGLLHTVQDFYSHSNWVELFQDQSPVPVWDLDPSSLPAAIVSGTYGDSPKLCGPGAPTHAELNKDSPGSTEGQKVVAAGPNQGATLFQLAYNTAVAATRVQFAQLAPFLGH
jgi:hypothetical protein